VVGGGEYVLVKRGAASMFTQKRTKIKCRQYITTYLMLGFMPSPSNIQLPMCLFSNKVFSNDVMKASRLHGHFQKVYPEKQNKDLSYFTNIRDKFLNAQSISGLLAASSKQYDYGFIASI